MTAIEAKARQLARVQGAPAGSYDVCKEAIALEMSDWIIQELIDKAVYWVEHRAEAFFREPKDSRAKTMAVALRDYLEKLY